MKIIDEYQKYFTTKPAPKIVKEGLILTHPMTKSISVIEKAGFDVILLKDDKYENRFFVEVYEATGDADKLFAITDNLGWFCSQIRGQGKYGTDSVKFTRSNLRDYLQRYDAVLLLFEPKYDLPISLYEVDYLYHATTMLNWKRIEKQGLTPKTANKTASHPERIYLALTATAAERFAIKIANSPRVEPNPKHKFNPDAVTWVILRIRTSLLDDRFRFYADPNYYKKGGYTLNSISPVAISLFKVLD